MKIVCDACQAKYSISDDKVQGKVFKIRCKKCSNIIVVRGGAGASGAADPAPSPTEKDTRVYDYGYEGGADQAPAGEDAVWHLVINQDQVGPLTAAEVQQKFSAGEIDAETFTWREGFADWLPLAQVDQFAGIVAAGAVVSSSNGGGGAAAVSAMFGAGADDSATRNDGGDLFSAAGVTSTSGGAPRPTDEDDAGDLFGSSKPAAAAQNAANQKLRGERNENSVLFSLNNLAQLASDTPRPAAAAASSSSGGGGAPAGHATGASGGEGSGLIDIRSMASAYMGGTGGGAAIGKPSASSAIGSIDDLPVFGGGGFSEPAVIVPTARPAANNKMLFLMISAVGLLAVVAIVMVVVLLKGGDKKEAVASNDDKLADKGDKKVEDKGTEPAGSAADTHAAGSAVAVAPEGGGEPKTEPKAEPKAPSDSAKAEPKKDPKHSSTPKAEPKTTGGTVARVEPKKVETPKAEPKAPEAGGCDEVSCVLNNYEGACCSKFKKGGGPKAPAGGGEKKSGGDLPDSLDRAMISSGIAAVKARVTSCGDKSPAKGKVKVHVKVGGDGKVANVSVETTPDAALGACVAGAVQKASFGKTASGGSFSYPFVF